MRVYVCVCVFVCVRISSDGDVKGEVKCRIGKAARAFGCLQKPIFQNHRLSVETKRKVYRAVVLSVLLYGAETWAIKAESVRRLSGFHNRCIRTILGVSRYQQWKERLTSRGLAVAFGMEETMVHRLMRQRLRWLCHLDRMELSYAQAAVVWRAREEEALSRH